MNSTSIKPWRQSPAPIANRKREVRLPLLVLLIASLAVASLAPGSLYGVARANPFDESNPDSKVAAMTKILITIDGKAVTATIEDNPTSRDFIALLPLTLKLEDFHETEKISDLPARLSTEGAPSGYAPSTGDIAYYAPWGNLAIFYRDFEHAKGLVHLGHIDSGGELFKQAGALRATIEYSGQKD